MFFRQEKYSNLAWRVILESGIDEGWIEHLAAQGITLAGKKHFTDPVTGAPIGTEHLMATLEMCLRSPGTADRVTVGDMGGWAGDLASFYEGWRTVKEQYPNPMLYALDYLGRRDTVSKFSNDDWVQDTDAFNIMRLIRTEEINLPTAFVPVTTAPTVPQPVTGSASGATRSSSGIVSAATSGERRPSPGTCSSAWTRTSKCEGAPGS